MSNVDIYYVRQRFSRIGSRSDEHVQSLNGSVIFAAGVAADPFGHQRFD